MNGPKILIWGLGLVIALGLAVALTRPAGPIRQDVDPAQLRALQAQGVRLIDVRSPGEYAIGHIPGAENVPVDQLTQLAPSWDKNSPILVYCSSGSRSNIAAQYLAANGFTKVYNLKSGLETWDGQLTKNDAPVAAVKTNGKPIFIDFYSDTWPICIKLKPVVNRLEKKYAGRIEFRRLDANAASSQQLANTYGVEYLPTFVFLDKRGNRTDQWVGDITEQALTNKLDALAATAYK